MKCTQVLKDLDRGTQYFTAAFSQPSIIPQTQIYPYIHTHIAPSTSPESNGVPWCCWSVAAWSWKHMSQSPNRQLKCWCVFLRQFSSVATKDTLFCTHYMLQDFAITSCKLVTSMASWLSCCCFWVFHHHTSGLKVGRGWNGLIGKVGFLWKYTVYMYNILKNNF